MVSPIQGTARDAKQHADNMQRNETRSKDAHSPTKQQHRSTQERATQDKKEGNDENKKESEEIYKIIMLGTSEPFGSKLLDMDEDILTMSSTSALEVAVSRTVKGSDSQYLPEVYKPLYVG